MHLIIKFVCAAHSRFYIILFLFKSVNRRQIYTTIRAQADAIHNAKYLSYAEMYFFLWGIRFALSLPQRGNAYCLSAKAQRPSLAGVLSEAFHTLWCFSVVSSLPLACVAEEFKLCHCGLLIFATFLNISLSKDLVILKRMLQGTDWVDFSARGRLIRKRVKCCFIVNPYLVVPTLKFELRCHF